MPEAARRRRSSALRECHAPQGLSRALNGVWSEKFSPASCKRRGLQHVLSVVCALTGLFSLCPCGQIAEAPGIGGSRHASATWVREQVTAVFIQVAMGRPAGGALLFRGAMGLNGHVEEGEGS